MTASDKNDIQAFSSQFERAVTAMRTGQWEDAPCTLQTGLLLRSQQVVIENRNDLLFELDVEMRQIARHLTDHLVHTFNTGSKSDLIMNLPVEFAVGPQKKGDNRISLDYHSIRAIEGLRELLDMAKAAKIGMTVEFYSDPRHDTLLDIKAAHGPANHMRERLFSGLKLKWDVNKGFDAEKYPEKLQRDYRCNPPNAGWPYGTGTRP